MLDGCLEEQVCAGVDAWEAQRRRAILADIEKRIAADGVRVAKPDPSRARQFMPFAALRGYGEMVDACSNREEESTSVPFVSAP